MLEKLGTFLKENWGTFVFFLVFTVLLNVPLPYFIYVPGGIKNMEERVTIEGSTSQSKGSFNLVYVTEYRATIPLYLYSLFQKNHELVPMEEVKYTSEESIQDIQFRDAFSLEKANQNALFIAYQKADKSLKIIQEHFYVLYLDPLAKTDLKIGDEILEVNGTPMIDSNSVKKAIANLQTGASISFKIKRDNKEIEKKAILYEQDGNRYVGIRIGSLKDYQEDPKITFHFSKSESGPSAGLVTALSIYNALTQEDITKGKRIVCTGTIEEDGTVGEIGSVVFKLHAAVKNKADVFLVPQENYEEVLKAVKEHGYSILVYPVKNFDDALDKLKHL